jgi:uncharacterized membrane protein YqiK
MLCCFNALLKTALCLWFARLTRRKFVGSNLAFIGTIVGAIVVLLVVLGITLTRLYKRASKEFAFVRTGVGGQKVVKDAGSLVLPVFHETIPVNMQTLCLTVDRKDTEALITKDRLRVNVKAEFYLRVKPDVDSIAAAAQTLGRRTLSPTELGDLIQGKFVDSLRAAAAGMDMQDLHEKRTDFVQKVRNTLAEDLTTNGLELESVALTNLNQTDVKFFDPNNAFDAEGLTRLTQVTQTRAKERNEIEQNARIEIETKNLEANGKSLELKQATEFATLEQERQVETRRAEQEAQLATQRAERKRESELAQISAEQAVEQGRVAKDQAVKIAETEAAQAQELAAQDRNIAVAERSKQQSKATAEAEAARAESVRATQEVITVQTVAEAERAKRVAVISAEQDAEKDATRIRVIAQAEYEAADATAKAKERGVEADAKRYQVEAAGQRAINEAANVTTSEQMAYQVRMALVEKMPEIIREMTRPIEKVDSIRVVQLTGLNGQGGAAALPGGNGTTGNLATDLTNSMLNYRLQSPIVDELAAELGVDLKQGLNGVLAAVAPTTTTTTSEASAGATEATVETSTSTVRDSHPDTDGLSEEERTAIQTLAGITPVKKASARRG